MTRANTQSTKPKHERAQLPPRQLYREEQI